MIYRVQCIATNHSTQESLASRYCYFDIDSDPREVSEIIIGFYSEPYNYIGVSIYSYPNFCDCQIFHGLVRESYDDIILEFSGLIKFLKNHFFEIAKQKDLNPLPKQGTVIMSLNHRDSDDTTAEYFHISNQYIVYHRSATGFEKQYIYNLASTVTLEQILNYSIRQFKKLDSYYKSVGYYVPSKFITNRQIIEYFGATLAFPEKFEIDLKKTQVYVYETFLYDDNIKITTNLGKFKLGFNYITGLIFISPC